MRNWELEVRIRFIMNFICEVTGRYADDYYIVFSMLCRTFIMYWILGLRQIFRSLHGAMGASRPTDYFIVHHTFSNVTQPNIFERRICAAIHHNYSLFFITYSFYSPIIPPTQQIVDITKTALRSPGRRFQLFRLSRSISYFYNN